MSVGDAAIAQLRRASWSSSKHMACAASFSAFRLEAASPKVSRRRPPTLSRHSARKSGVGGNCKGEEEEIEGKVVYHH